MDPTHLERMGRELKCPICWSLLDSAVSLTCNHVFCNSCIEKSMKSASNCPVCKVPFGRREVRPAPHMDNLVSIYKSMEVASGISIFVTQNAPVTKLSDGEKHCEGDANCSEKGATGTHQDQAQEKKYVKGKGSKKNTDTSKKSSGVGSVKPSFLTKKRVQVPQSPLSETPLRILKLGGSLNDIHDEETQKGSTLSKERPLGRDKKIVLSPFFWLREKDDDDSSQQTVGDEPVDTSTPNAPSFSDLKDSDDEDPSEVPQSGAVEDKTSADLFDSEMFEWTQRPCSPELCLSPFKMQVEDTDEPDVNQEINLVTASQVLEANKLCSEKRKFGNLEEGNGFADVLHPSAGSPQNGSSVDQNGVSKSRKRGRKAKERAHKMQTSRQSDQVNGIEVDLNGLSKVSHELTDNGNNSSNWVRTNKRGKRVCFNVKPSPQTSQAVLDIPGVLTNEVNLLGNISALPCEEHGKDSVLRNADKNQKKRSGKWKLECVHDILDQSSSVQNQTGEHAGSPSSIPCLRMVKENAPNSRQSRSNVSKISESCNRELRSKRKSKALSDCTSQQKCIIEMQSIERIPLNTDIQTSHNKAEEEQCSLNGVVLRKCKTHIKSHHCAFCLLSEESEASGEMMHYCNGRPVTADYGGPEVIHSHRNCSEWAPNVYFEDDIAINLEAEITRSKRIKCSFCGLKGAALGCYEKSCRRSFHIPCAKWTSQCRWDMDNFVMLCPLHTSSKLPCESPDSRQRSSKCKNTERSNLKCSNDTRKQDTSTSHNWTAHRSFKKIVLCCSALSVQERDVVSEFEKAFKVTVMKSWDSSVTHVVASTDENGACKRTLKVLQGILEGKWILNMEWIIASMKAMKPVDEECYEIAVDIHGIKDGPRLGRLRILNKQPKLFNGYKFYFTGDFMPSYKGYLQDLVTAAGGVVLHRKPVSSEGKIQSSDVLPSCTLIIYSLELPDECDPSSQDKIFRQRRCDAEALASSTGSKVASNSWILNSIAACKLQSLTK